MHSNNTYTYVMHAPTHMHAHTYIYTHPCTRTHAHMHACTHTRTQSKRYTTLIIHKRKKDTDLLFFYSSYLYTANDFISKNVTAWNRMKSSKIHLKHITIACLCWQPHPPENIWFQTTGWKAKREYSDLYITPHHKDHNSASSKGTYISSVHFSGLSSFPAARTKCRTSMLVRAG